ncbi:Uncharacterised protein [Yersinia frederiksenii]|nr:Uncharacterised protein [Yersinia frederiksenii]CNI24570.1 Uncharacterised protein [Yersinia frederiksenii]
MIFLDVSCGVKRGVDGTFKGASDGKEGTKNGFSDKGLSDCPLC